MPLTAATADTLALALRDASAGWATLGAIAGALLAVAPGLSAAAILALLLPAVYWLGAGPAAALMVAAYAGAHVGTAFREILVARSPSAIEAEPDGALLSRQGRAAWAVLAVALASAGAAAVGLTALTLALPPLQRLVGDLGPAEIAALSLAVLTGSVVVAAGSLRQSIAMAALGVLLAIGGVGLLPAAWTTHSLPRTLDGDALGRLHFVVLAMGLIGFGALTARAGDAGDTPTGGLAPCRTTLLEWRHTAGATLRGIAIGWPIGLLPGSGSRLGAYLALRAERRRAAAGPNALGKGDVRGVAGPQAARHAGMLAALLAVWSLGLPFNATTAVLFDGARLQPSLHAPAFWWALLASLAIAHAALLVLAWPLAAVAVRLATVPRAVLVAILVLGGCAAVHAVRGQAGDVYGVAVCALAAQALRLLRCSPAPLLLGYATGPVLDDNLARALQVSAGAWAGVGAQPVVVISLGLAGLTLCLCAVPGIAARRRRAFG